MSKKIIKDKSSFVVVLLGILISIGLVAASVYATSIGSSIVVTNNASIGSNLTVSGSSTIGTNLTVNNNLTVSGSTNLATTTLSKVLTISSGGASITGPLALSGSLTQSGGNVSLATTTISGGLNAFTLLGSITGSGSPDISGIGNFSGANLSLTGNATTTGNQYIGGNENLVGNLVVGNNIEIGGDYTRTCPTGYIWVPGSAKFGTLPGFCVMKYEAKKDGTTNCGGGDCPVSKADGAPWVSISQTDAITKCRQLGPGYHLISDKEWMTIAYNVAYVDSNWSGGAVGSGTLARGWTNTGNTAVAPSTGASCLYNTGANTCGSTGDLLYRRTLTLSNGNVIWDFSGNVWEWTDAWIYSDGTGDEMPDPNNGWNEYATSTTATAITSYITNFKGLNYIRPPVEDGNGWNSNQGIGRIYSDPDAAYPSGNYHVFIRGGNWYVGAYAGAFALYLNDSPAYTNPDSGFRCAQ